MPITTLNSQAIPADVIQSSDLDYPLTDFSSTGIDDSATSTAITIDSSQNVGIRTTSPDSILHLSGTSGSKIIIEDSANPRQNYIGIDSSDNLVLAADEDNLGTSSNIQFRVDATERMRIDSSGRLLIGTSSSRETSGGGRQLQIEGTNGVTSSASITRNQNSASGPNLTLGKTRATGVGGNSAVIDGDDLGAIYFAGADGTDLNTVGASILSEVDGTPSSNVMPANLIFSTNQGGSGVTEAMRISSNGQLKIGGTTNSPANVQAVLFGTGNASLLYDTGHTGLHINNENATAGLDNYGAGISFGRFASNSDDQSSAIVPVQTTSDQDHMGIAFLTHDTNTRANPLKEKMRIMGSGNVGIGETSPSTPLHIKSTTGDQVTLEANSTTIGPNLVFANTDGNLARIASAETNTLRFEIGPSNGEAMRVDSSGNVGIGTTSPSGTRLNVHAAGGDQLRLVSTDGATPTSILMETNTGFAARTRIRNDSGDITFVTSNTAERMRIDSSGNVGIGTTSAESKLHIATGTKNNTPLKIEGYLSTSSGSSLDSYQELKFAASGSDANSAGIRHHANVWSDGHSALSFWTSEHGGSYAERMRLSPSGALSINNTTNAEYLRIKGENGNQFAIDNNGSTFTQANWYNNGTLKGAVWYDNSKAELATYSTNELTFYSGTNSTTARATIDNSGRLLIGKTATSNATNGYFLEAGTGGYASFVNSATASSNRNILCNRHGGNGDTIQFRRANVQVGSISVTTSATSYNTTSDQRLKENIVDAPAGNIDGVRVRSFDWKSDGTHQTYGMVAQELVDVAPEAVAQGDTDDDMWSVDYSKLVPMMIKEIQDLRARVAQLEEA